MPDPLPWPHVPIRPQAPTAILRLRLRVLLALMQNDLRHRFRVSRWASVLVLFEPIFQFAVMFAIFWMINRAPAFGISLGLFLATGVVPYFTFMHLSGRVMGALRSGKVYGRVQTVSFLDLAIAKGTLEFLTLIFFGTVVFTLLAAFGHPAIPHQPDELILATTALGACAFGLGLVNGVLAKMSRVYALIYSIVARSMLFFSGVFYVPATLPGTAREWLSWNPILHCIEWFRLGFFPSYPAIDLDRGYLCACALALTTLGLVLMRVFDGKLKE